MSITYPEARPSLASKRAGDAAVMNSGSALFPSGSTSVYERASKARNSKNMPLAWIAAPLAVVAIGGGIYLAMTHNPAAPIPVAKASIASKTTTTVTPNTPAPALKVDQAAPATAQTHVVQKSVQKVTQPIVGATRPAVHVTRSTTVNRQVQAPVAAPAPAAIAPAPAASAPTPGTFTLTPAPAASAPSTTPDVVTPPAAAAAPAPSADAQPAPQA